MFKSNFFVVKFKKLILPFFICLFILFLLLFSENNIKAAKNGLGLWVNSVLPTLLPFFIATNLLLHTQVVYYLGIFFNKYMRPIFNVPGEGSFALIMGIISGYPMGAKIVSEFKDKKICTTTECERLLAFTNNSGPLFIIGTVGISLFANTYIGFLLFFVHLISCLTVGFLFRFWKYNSEDLYRHENIYTNGSSIITFGNLGEILSSSIMSSINLVVMIGGFVVLFSVIISMLNSSHILDLISNIFANFNISSGYIKGIITGLIEVTNGVQCISNIVTKSVSTNIIICAFLLGFGGFSVFLQVLSITSKAHISIKPYIIGKILQAIFSVIYMVPILKFIPFFNFNL